MKYQDTYQYAFDEICKMLFTLFGAITWSATQALLSGDCGVFEYFVNYFVGLGAGFSSFIFLGYILDDLPRFRVSEALVKADDAAQKQQEQEILTLLTEIRNLLREQNNKSARINKSHSDFDGREDSLIKQRTKK